MNLREKIEDNLTVWLLSTLVTGFLAGLGAYGAVLEIAQLEVISKIKLEQLQAAASNPAASPSAVENLSGGANPKPIEASASIDKAPASASSAQVQELRLSPVASPFPEHYDSVRPGMRLSEAQLALPGGRLNAGYYVVDLDSSLFSSVQFMAFAAESDPKIETVSFSFRDDSVRQIAISSLLKKIGHLPHKSESLGQRLVWSDVNGFTAVIGDHDYAIAAKEE